MKLQILFIEDNDEYRQSMVDYFDEEKIGQHTLKTEGAATFENGIERLQQGDYDIVVLDLYKGDPSENAEKLGLTVLAEIQKIAFIPVIFFSGLTKDITDLRSEVVGIVNKGEGFEALSSELERIISSNLALIKGQIYGHVKESLREYFWDTVHARKQVFVQGQDDFSLGYLLLRRLAISLSKEKIKLLLGDDKINPDKAHPMEFYIYPPTNYEYEAGEILLKNGHYYVILTPSCDFVCRAGSTRKAERILLARAFPLNQQPEFARFEANRTPSNRDSLKRVIESAKSDRYFFLPGTPFMENLLIDFQNKELVLYDELATFERVAKLDDPFAQAMISSFIRYYNRIGYPDIDADYVLGKF